MPSPPDGGRQAQPCPRGSLAKARGTLPCETDRAKPERMSHDWHVQPSCQRSLRKLGLSRFPFGSRLRPEGLICPRTWCASPASKSALAAAFSQFTSAAGVFARTFRKYRTFDFMSSRSGLPARYPFPTPVAQRKTLKHPTGKMPDSAPSGLAGTCPGSCNGLFSLGIPYRGSGGLLQPSPGPTNRPPTLPNPGRTAVHREAPLLNLQLFKSSTGYPALQPALLD
jgi:hypothetical protein